MEINLAYVGNKEEFKRGSVFNERVVELTVQETLAERMCAHKVSFPVLYGKAGGCMLAAEDKSTKLPMQRVQEAQ